VCVEGSNSVLNIYDTTDKELYFFPAEIEHITHLLFE